MGESNLLDPQRAIERLEESLALYREVGDLRRAAMVMYKIAEASVRAGADLEQPEAYVQESLGVFEAMGSIHDSAHALLELGRIRRRRGNPNGATEALETGLERMRLVGDQRCETRTLTALGTALIDRGEPAEAWRRLKEAIRLASEIGERQMTRVALAGLGRISAGRGRIRDAAVLTAAASRIGAELGMRPSSRSSAGRARRLADLRDRLGDAEFEAAWQEGSSMRMEEAMEMALSIAFPASEPTPQ